MAAGKGQGSSPPTLRQGSSLSQSLLPGLWQRAPALVQEPRDLLVQLAMPSGAEWPP